MRVRRRIMAVAVGASLALSLVGVPSGSAGAASGSHSITAGATKVFAAKKDKWQRVHTYIGKGQRVKWINSSKKVHDFKTLGNKAGWNLTRVLKKGERFGKKFRKLGTFRYRCVRHSAMINGKCKGMCGFIHVLSNN